ncbi:MAG: HD domain-containing protein [Flavobacteriales bacterium]|nr:HD domain-containing protein [Flavobacteriales bacterium]
MHAGLPRLCTYHSLEHTLDVYASVITIAEEEGIAGEDLELLKTAALYHDSGFLVDPENHEAGGCRMAREHLPRFGYDEVQVERICAMIMATKIPQQAHDRLSEVLCDADLDYLGREDFFLVGERLYQEMKAHGGLSNRREWNLLQEEFISKHSFFTETSRALREPKKQEHLEWVRQWLRDNP